MRQLAYNASVLPRHEVEDLMTLADKIRELREKAGMSQSQLAKASGIPTTTIQGYEQGRREPLWDGLFKLSTALGVSCEAFAGCVGFPVGNPRSRGPSSRPKKK